MTFRIVVGVDGSDASRSALRWAAGEARLRGASLLVLTAYRFPLAFAGVGADATVAAPDEQEQAERIQRAVLDEAADDLAGLDVATSIEAGEGPGHAIVSAAEDADLLVVGQHGLGGVSGFTLGSVSHYCVGRASCPVVVVPAAG